MDCALPKTIVARSARTTYIVASRSLRNVS
jgi:hypothetical protein